VKFVVSHARSWSDEVGEVDEVLVKLNEIENPGHPEFFVQVWVAGVGLYVFRVVWHAETTVACHGESTNWVPPLPQPALFKSSKEAWPSVKVSHESPEQGFSCFGPEVCPCGLYLLRIYGRDGGWDAPLEGAGPQSIMYFNINTGYVRGRG
jgi:hypothetical protein